MNPLLHLTYTSLLPAAAVTLWMTPLTTFRPLQAFRVACHYGDTETEMDSSLRSTSTVVFNRLVIFVLKEADEIFRQLLGVSKDTDLASGAVKRQPRYALSSSHARPFLSRLSLWSHCSAIF